MKNIKALVAVALAFSAGIQSINLIPTEAASKSDVTIEEKSNEESGVGKIYLSSMASPYSWEYAVKDEEIVEIGDMKLVDSDYPTLPGSSQEYVWDVKGLKEGKTEVVFNYLDAYRDRVDVQKTKIYEVQVDSHLNVTVTEKSEDNSKSDNIYLGRNSEGYEWNCSIADTNIAEAGDYLSFKLKKGPYTTEPEFLSISEVDSWKIKGLKEGETEAVFTYLRTNDKKIVDKATYSIKVDSDLNVTVTLKERESNTKKVRMQVKGNPEIKYRMNYEADDYSIVDLHADESAEKPQDADYDIWEIRPKKEGETKVQFCYKNEYGEILEKLESYLIKVDSDYNVTVTKLPQKDEPALGIIELEGNESTGYEWNYDIKDVNIADIVNKTRVPHSDIPGDSQMNYWKVKGLQEGETEITFKYFRPWEPESVIETKIYTIKVDSNLNVTVSEKCDQEKPTPDPIITDAKEGKIELDANPTTGYDWSYDAEDNNIAEISDVKYISDNLQADGAGGKYTWKVKGIKEGETKVTFKYQRQGDTEPVKIFSYIINVDSDLNVTVIDGDRIINPRMDSIMLTGNLSTGYDWQYDIEDKETADIVDKKVDSDDPADPMSGNTFTWKVRGFKEGQTEIKFKYLRPWETKVAETKTYVVTVDSDLNATVTEK
ncbi:MAG: protease inhibitor I42 family protein [Clostridium sp.]